MLCCLAATACHLFFQREIPGEKENANAAEEGVYKTAWERSVAVDYAMRLLTWQVFSHLHVFLGNKSL